MTAVYPNLRYHALTDTVPEVIGAPGVWGSDLAGAGAGVKVGVIDDGIDQHHPFFAPRGLVAPPGFPKGVRVVHDREGHRRARVRGSRSVAPRPAAVRPERLATRDPRRRDPGRRPGR